MVVDNSIVGKDIEKSDLKFKLYIHIAQFIIYSVYLIYVIKYYRKIIQKAIKAVFVSFWLMSLISIIICRLVYSHTWPLSIYSTFVRVNLAINLILMYKILFLLKRVELQINPKYQTAQEILKILTKMVKTERIYLAINTTLVILMILFDRSVIPDYFERIERYFFYILSFMMLILDIYLNYFFYRMISFFLNIMIKSTK